MVQTWMHRLIAALNGKVKVVRVLLEHGAKSGAENEEGKTPFQIAEARGPGRGYDEIMYLLSGHASGARSPP
jgi:ankyrin repeat protein